MRHHLRTIIIVGLTVGLMAYFLRNAQLERVLDSVSRARVDLLVAAVILTLLSYLLRVERWRRLLQPVGDVSFSSAARATVIGFAANALLPGRVGEVLRPYVLARRERLSGPSAFATIVLERLFDLLAIVMTVAGFIVLSDPPTSDPQLLATLRAGALVGAAMAVMALAGSIVLSRKPDQAIMVARWCAFIAPGGVARVVTRPAQRFLQGLAIVRRPGPLVVATALSVLLWVTVSLSMLMTSWAFGIDVSFGGSLILMGMVAIGVAVPTPAGVGGYHAAYQLGATALYGAGVDEAVAAALVMHVIAFGPVTVLGLVFMAQEGLRLTSLSGFGAGSGESPLEPSEAGNDLPLEQVPAMSVAPTDDGGSAA